MCKEKGIKKANSGGFGGGFFLCSKPSSCSNLRLLHSDECVRRREKANSGGFCGEFCGGLFLCSKPSNYLIGKLVAAF